MPKLIAERDTQLAIVHDDDETGFIYNMGEEQRFPDQNIHSILARGYWEEPASDLPSDELDRIANLPVAGGGR
jgi:hypothetical protein